MSDNMEAQATVESTRASESSSSEEGSEVETEKYVCSYKDCDKAFIRFDRLIQHQRVHTGERPFVCPEVTCCKSYARSSHLKRHVEQSHVKVRTPADVFICEIKGCYNTFVSNDNLKRHVAQVHMENTQRYMCKVDGCRALFSKRFQLRLHEFEHQGVKPFQCHIVGCLKQFKQRSHLTRHMKSHNGYKCEVDGCGANFEKWSQLRKHNSIQHKKLMHCQHCHKSFHSDKKLEQHETICSSKETQFKTCSEDVETQIELELFACHYEGCSRMYTRRSNLKHHVNVCHEMSVVFGCDHPGCNVTFATKQKMQNHKKTHGAPMMNEKKSKKTHSSIPQSDEIQLSDICDNFKNLNSPFVYLERMNMASISAPKLLDEGKQFVERLKRMRRKDIREQKPTSPTS